VNEPKGEKPGGEKAKGQISQGAKQQRDKKNIIPHLIPWQAYRQVLNLPEMPMRWKTELTLHFELYNVYTSNK